jgi:hypothetical protein
MRMYYIHTLLAVNHCALSVGVLWKLRCIRVTLTLYLVYPHDGVDDRMAMLSK